MDMGFVIRSFIYILISLLFLSRSDARADDGQIIVADTQGIPRATETVHDRGDVTFELVDGSGMGADGVEVSLTDQARGTVKRTYSVNGTATFKMVSPGGYTVATPASGITFTQVQISGGGTIGASLSGSNPGRAIGGGRGNGAGATLGSIGESVAEVAPVVVVAGGIGAAGILIARRISRDNDDDDGPSIVVPTPAPLSQSR